ncbi:c-type cytochrome [Bacteriovoracaceae bacterium]|nr:c-type cytochrome [Bacteriovoracaceae bacterium]
MKNLLKVMSLLTITLMLTSCEDKAFREGKIVAGGQYVSADTLNKGKQIYAEYCMACHGVDGDGKGVAHKGLEVPPRNFKLGIIKFGDVVSGDLPHDESIYKSLKHGLKGSAMLEWDLKPGQMNAVWQYIKTFAPDVWIGKDKELGEKIVPTKDPFGLARKSAAINIGKAVYHVSANCQSCHRGYVTGEEFNQMSMKLTGESAEIDEEFYKIKTQESDHGYLTVPPDFTWHEIKSAQTVEELYLRLAAGVGGTSMPAWKGTIEDEEIWAVAHYVRSLMDLKNTPKRKELMDRLGQ